MIDFSAVAPNAGIPTKLAAGGTPSPGPPSAAKIFLSEQLLVAATNAATQAGPGHHNILSGLASWAKNQGKSSRQANGRRLATNRELLDWLPI